MFWNKDFNHKDKWTPYLVQGTISQREWAIRSTNQGEQDMKMQHWAMICICFVFLGVETSGCAKKNEVPVHFEKMAEYTDRLGQANVKLYRYTGQAELENIKAYSGKLGCKMLYAYFYPDTVPMNEIPVEEISSATTYSEVQEILYEREGFARWHYAVQCFAVIPFVTDCIDSPVSQNCR